MNRNLLRQAFVLGLLTTIGPFGIDMYLPALPELSQTLGAGSRAAQATLASYFLAVGAGQLLAGPITDAYGRKRPIFVGLAVFLLASVGCAMAHSIGALVALRVLQGLGACTCMVAPRAIVRDLHTGPAAARLMSLLLTIYSISPILAPAAGSLIASHFGWRGVFAALAAVSAMAAVAVALLLPETRAPAARQPGGIRTALLGYRDLFRDVHFLRAGGVASFALASFFVYVAQSPFVIRSHYGVQPATYSILFALNAVAVVTVSQANGWLARRIGLERSVTLATRMQALLALALLVFMLAGEDRLPFLAGMLMAVFACNGVTIPAVFVLAMDAHAARAGSASAFLGTLNFAGGAVAIAAASPFSSSAPVPMVAAIAMCTFVAFALAVGSAAHRRQAAATATTGSHS
jgi:DHA1 family bicyclomycin/chloramphenicol resistance-like MFS transporter